MEFSEILNKEKTPFYVFDTSALEKRIKYLREHLPKNVELCYAVKANTFISKKASELVDRLRSARRVNTVYATAFRSLQSST